MDIISYGWSRYRDCATDLPFYWVFCLAKLGLTVTLPVILCFLAGKAGNESEKANYGLAIFGAMVGIAWPLSPENWGDASRINVWILPLAAFSLIVCPIKLAYFLSDDNQRQINILGSLWLSIAVTLGLNLIIR